MYKSLPLYREYVKLKQKQKGMLVNTLLAFNWTKFILLVLTFRFILLSVDVNFILHLYLISFFLQNLVLIFRCNL